MTCCVRDVLVWECETVGGKGGLVMQGACLLNGTVQRWRTSVSTANKQTESVWSERGARGATFRHAGAACWAARGCAAMVGRLAIGQAGGVGASGIQHEAA